MSTAEQGTICTRNIKTQFLSLTDTASFSSGTLHAVLKSTANVQTCSCKTVKCSTDRRVTGQCGRSSVQSLFCQQAVPRLRRSVAGLSPRRPRFAVGSDHVAFVMDKVAIGQVFLLVLRLSPVSIIPPWFSTLITWGWTIGPLVAAVQRHSFTP
jgi:hypothetical protein